MATPRPTNRLGMVCGTWLSAIVLSACSAGNPLAPSPTTQASQIATATPIPLPSQAPIQAKFDIGDKKLHLECIGAGSPVVVIEVGDDDTIHGSWEQVYFPLSEVSRVCAYDRANLGQSDPDPGPRTVQDLGDELITLLKVAKVPGPYLFVGGSFGGNIVSVLAATHPKVVAGLVFVDSDPDNANPKLDPMKQNLNPKVYARCCDPSLFEPAFNDPVNTEHIDWQASRATGLASVRNLPKVPTIVLTATELECQPDWPCDAIRADEIRLQQLWIEGNPLGEQRLVSSGHVMQREAPRSIVDAVQDILTTLRSS